jgi:alcohol dehydrogenase class IV
MDFAKALSIIMTHGGLLEDYVGEGTVPGPVTPIVCVPTTSGTGSQCTQTTVFTTGGVKLGCSSEYIRPVDSIVDPELTMGLPAVVTRNAGYDALMHAIESFLARPHAQVPERPILLAGIAFSHSGLGLVHAFASSLGGMIETPHGVCLAACTNIGLTYNFRVCEKDLAILAAIAEKKDGLSSNQISAEGFLTKIKSLIRVLGLPSRPSDLGIKKGDAREILEKTLLQTRRFKTNPRPLDNELLSYIEKGI